MLLEQRKKCILKYIMQNGGGSITQLSELLKVSEMTVRRDLKILDDEGLIQRTHGGALQANNSSHEPRYDEKKGFHHEVKETIARYAVEHFVKQDSVIIMEGGTTVTCMANYLNQCQRLTVVTNGLNTLGMLKSQIPHTSVLCCGGMLRDISHTFVGPLAEQFFEGIHAHYVFFSTSGLAMDHGFTDPNMLEVQVKKAMCRAAKTKVMLVDSTKFGKWSLQTTFAIREIDILI
ncbi:MAG: DeoR/GlpR transcriptional regulator, partial [Gorillibacterium sp.]|nr:DeoR/GlpR transcriptional regulator [Gorillibacterium sp.]